MNKLVTLSCLVLLGIASTSTALGKEITLINPFEVPAKKLEETILFWETARDFLQTQPGYISTSLHQSITDDARFRLINIAKWESAEAFIAASKKCKRKQDYQRLKDWYRARVSTQ